MKTIKQKTGSEHWKGPLSEPAFGPVNEPKQVNDQRSTSVFRGMPTGSPEVLPLFMETLYKARDFDPL